MPYRRPSTNHTPNEWTTSESPPTTLSLYNQSVEGWKKASWRVDKSGVVSWSKMCQILKRCRHPLPLCASLLSLLLIYIVSYPFGIFRLTHLWSQLKSLPIKQVLSSYPGVDFFQQAGDSSQNPHNKTIREEILWMVCLASDCLLQWYPYANGLRLLQDLLNNESFRAGVPRLWISRDDEYTQRVYTYTTEEWGSESTYDFLIYICTRQVGGWHSAPATRKAQYWAIILRQHKKWRYRQSGCNDTGMVYKSLFTKGRSCHRSITERLTGPLKYVRYLRKYRQDTTKNLGTKGSSIRYKRA